MFVLERLLSSFMFLTTGRVRACPSLCGVCKDTGTGPPGIRLTLILNRRSPLVPIDDANVDADNGRSRAARVRLLLFDDWEGCDEWEEWDGREGRTDPCCGVENRAGLSPADRHLPE